MVAERFVYIMFITIIILKNIIVYIKSANADMSSVK